ncbi:hypothetical protein [Spongiibacter tropicus]|uniref:hypothetical protein n=1 Tax=Spongiibacter tropicus TaxID=454602 RepID=UPI0035BE77A1
MSIRVSYWISAFFLVLWVQGCTSGQHITSSDGICLTCVNNPITGKPINYDPSEYPESTVSANRELSSHAAFRQEAVGLVSRGFSSLPQDNLRLRDRTDYVHRDGIVVGEAIWTSSITALKLKQFFGVKSLEEMRAQGMSQEEIRQALQQKPYRQSRSTYYMGGTFSGAAGPITGVIAVYPYSHEREHSLIGVYVIGYDKAHKSTRKAQAGLYNLVLQAINYNQAN